MSAFMVADETINRVVTWLYWEVRKSEWLKRKVENELHLDTERQDFEQNLGQAMFELNIAGVNVRYGEGEAKRYRDLAYRYTPAHGSKIQVLKSMQCFLYQCMEGEVVKKPLYRFFRNTIEVHLMESIINDLPEYNQAEWG